MILIWNLVFKIHFIEYQYFTLGEPLRVAPGAKTNFMLNLFLLFIEDII